MEDDLGPIGTDRTLLVLMSREFMKAILAGDRQRAGEIMRADIADEWPDEGDRWLLQIRIEQLDEDPAAAPWLVRAIVERDTGRMVGHIGFHGPPDERGVVEVGYTVLGEFRRRGFAEEAVRAVFEWAYRRHEIKRFRASVSPTNDPSLRLIGKFGFVQVGVQWDERDGQELVFEANYPPTS